MGNHSSNVQSENENENNDKDVCFDDFSILRAIGKGAFGKVCVVKKKPGGKLFALKYMNKAACIEKDAVKNVLKEVEILAQLEHPALVNLLYSFSDDEDMFLVVDLLLGGDLRFHLQQKADGKLPGGPSGGLFNESQVAFYICEIGLALEYLKQQHVLHRDLKPDNLLFDSDGHLHLTDFNVAVILQSGELAKSISGTKPYMAPEMFGMASGTNVDGYSFEVDWWALGVTAYEMLRGKRPFDIQSGTSLTECAKLVLETKLTFTQNTSERTKSLISQLLHVVPDSRISCMTSLMACEALDELNADDVLARRIPPTFKPPQGNLNCDPTFELEEMIIESRPLHKKKQRLAKAHKHSTSMDSKDDSKRAALEELERSFKPFNRFRRDLQLAAAQTSGDEHHEEYVLPLNLSTTDNSVHSTNLTMVDN